MIISGLEKINYLHVWSKVFCNQYAKENCNNVLHIIEILLISPFTNAKLERVFSRMNRVKTDSRNRLGQERLETQLRVGEEGTHISDFDPEIYITKWCEEKVRRISGAKFRNYPTKRKSSATSCGNVVMDIASYTLSDLESEEEDIEQL